MSKILEKNIDDSGGFLQLYKPELDISFYEKELDISLADLREMRITHKSRQDEYLRSRFCLKKGLQLERITELIKDEYGKLHLKSDEANISLSHTKEYVAITKSIAETGVDIEFVSDKIQRIAKKFLLKEKLESLAENTKSQSLTFVWCAKEAIYKAYGKKGIDYATQIELTQFEVSEFPIKTMGILNNGAIIKQYEINAEIYQGMVICWALEC